MSDPTARPPSKIVQAFKYAVFSLLPAVVLFSLVETSLKMAGFRYSDTPLMMARVREGRATVVDTVLNWNNLIGTQKEGVVYMVKDPKQLWVPRESYEQQHSVQKPAGVEKRIATLGDSCTAICIDTDRSYPSLLEDILNAGGPPVIEVLNAGVGSHSSFQGLRRLRFSVLKFKPDILTVFFGWNDHWVSNVPDSEVRVRRDWEVTVLNFLEQSRTYQAYHYLIAKILRRGAVQPVDEARPAGELERLLGVGLRVPLEQYAQNLEAMIELAGANSMKILLVTAPSDLSAFPGFSEFPFPKEVLIPVHERYNQTVREVAARRGVPILDLSTMVSVWAGERIHSADGIHFTPFGCRFVAERFAEKLRELQWAP